MRPLLAAGLLLALTPGCRHDARSPEAAARPTRVVAVLAIVGLPLAHWLAVSRWRGRFLVESLVTLPLVLPPTVLGFFILVASVISNLPFAVRPFTAAFTIYDDVQALDYAAAARTAGSRAPARHGATSPPTGSSRHRRGAWGSCFNSSRSFPGCR